MLIWNGKEWARFAGPAARDTEREDAQLVRLESQMQRLLAMRWKGMLLNFLQNPQSKYLRPADRMEMDAIRVYNS